MLVHQIQDSEGVVAQGVHLTNRNILGFRLSGICHAGIRFGSDGVLYKIQSNGGFSAIIGQWLLSGSSSSFWVERTIQSGTIEVDAGAGFLIMSSNRDYDSQLAVAGVKEATVSFKISSDSGGVTIVAEATMNFSNEQGGV